MKKILFLTHEAALSGAPRSLSYYIEWLKENKSDIHITTITLKDTADKNSKFKNLSHSFYDISTYSNIPNYSYANRIKRILFNKKITSERERLISALSDETFDLIYANTVSTLKLGIELKNMSVSNSLVLHVHEMRTAIEQLTPNFKVLAKDVDYFIAASEMVKNHLQNFFSIDSNRISRVYECSDIPEGLPLKNSISNSAHFNVIMVGAAYWAKGDDLFILVANEVIQRDHSIHFYWLGSQSLERETVNRGDIDKLGIQSNVHFLPHTSDPLKLVGEMDLFLLTSRSDSFPLAAIEAGLLGLPIVCFEHASGIQEIVEQGGGEVVPYLSITKMADSIIKFKNNPDLLDLTSTSVKSLFEVCKPNVISEELYQICKFYFTNEKTV